MQSTTKILKTSLGVSLKRFCLKIEVWCWRHYWGLLETTGIDLKVVENTRSQYKASYQVDRLTGARTRRELMIGAELGSSH
ncbi:hypothetical protein P8452_61336 [Trifolium repens]|nr:hypothetical protein P8452_61336 [Trifolium repens]